MPMSTGGGVPECGTTNDYVMISLGPLIPIGMLSTKLKALRGRSSLTPYSFVQS